ncbi:hypothetical protein GLP59_17105 [Sulfitobacter sp. M220]|uniref:hypothetical protein n=1 Tax=Sulfitobacter sp. M220 TaxID=2675333 RepID=UPI001F329D47|nr:hypothetical protein [Sulfitobacter sp. M220]MCF7779327.1 hypothetical protein [Sulfitobacter sp. M220]
MRARETLLAAKGGLETRALETRHHALKTSTGLSILLASGATELSNLFGYFRTGYEDAYLQLSTPAAALTLALAASGYVAIAYGIHCGYERLRDQDTGPAGVYLTCGVLALGLAAIFPLIQAGSIEDLLVCSGISVLAALVGGLGLSMLLDGRRDRRHHDDAVEGAGILEQSLGEYTTAMSKERSRATRLDQRDSRLKRAFALAFTAAHDEAIEALTLATASEGLPVPPFVDRLRPIDGMRPVAPMARDLIALVGDRTAIGLHRRLSGRSMSPREVSAVKRFLAKAPRFDVPAIYEQLT